MKLFGIDIIVVGIQKMKLKSFKLSLKKNWGFRIRKVLSPKKHGVSQIGVANKIGVKE